MTYGTSPPASAVKAPARRNLTAIGLFIVMGMAALALTATHVRQVVPGGDRAPPSPLTPHTVPFQLTLFFIC